MSRKVQRWTIATVVGFIAVCSAPVAARAAIQTSATREDLVCGDAIQLGIWNNADQAPSIPKRQRKVTMRAVDVATGKTWWKKTATATSKWRYWYLPSGRDGQCGTTKVTLTYRASGRTVVDREVVRFRPED
jgi:hypothetical protein